MIDLDTIHVARCYVDDDTDAEAQRQRVAARRLFEQAHITFEDRDAVERALSNCKTGIGFLPRAAMVMSLAAVPMGSTAQTQGGASPPAEGPMKVLFVGYSYEAPRKRCRLLADSLNRSVRSGPHRPGQHGDRY